MNAHTTYLKAARVEAEHARAALFTALEGRTGSDYTETAQRYVLASKVVSEAWAREKADILHPQSGSASVTLNQATDSLEALLVEIKADQRKLDRLTTALNILLGAILLFGL